MKISRTCFIVVAIALAASISAAAQGPKVAPSHSQTDAQIVRALSQVSAKNIEATINKLVSFHTRLTASTNLPASSGQGVLAARAWIKQQFENDSKACGGCLDVKVFKFTQPVSPRIKQPTEIGDVYAVLKGTDPEASKRIVLISGHYDSIDLKKMYDSSASAPGANDDGSGTATVLEAARVLSKYKFPATIIFLTVAGEEEGLYGSEGFAKMAKEQGWDIEAMLNNDIVGGDKSPGQNPFVVRIFSEGIPYPALKNPREVAAIRMFGYESDSPSRELARYVATTSALYAKSNVPKAMMIFRQDRFLRGGDHTSFNQQGFTAVRFTEYRENFNHQHQGESMVNGVEHGDLPKFVDFNYVARVARLNMATLASLASAPAPPAAVKVDMSKLENDTTLLWQPSPDGLAKSYEVVWRDTTAPQWEHSKNVGNVTTATMPESKDNVIFGVRAVDGKGHRSLVVVPMPQR